MTHKLTYKETKNLEKFYRDIHEEDIANDIEVIADHQLDKAREELQEELRLSKERHPANG